EKVLENKDVVLSAERYFETLKSQTEFELVELKEVCDIIRGITFGKKDQLDLQNNDTIKVATTKACQENGIVEKDLYNIPKRFIKDERKYLIEGDILVSTANSLNLLGRTTYVSELNYKASFGAFMSLIRVNKEKILPLYLLHCLKTKQAKRYFELNANTTTNISNLTFESLNSFQIPLPPLSIQQQIVAKIESFQKIIDGAKQIVNNYKPVIHINPDWEMVELGEVTKLVGGGTPSKANPLFWENGNIDWITCSDFSESPMYIKNSIRKITVKAVKESSTNAIPKGTLILVTRVSLGKLAFVTKP